MAQVDTTHPVRVLRMDTEAVFRNSRRANDPERLAVVLDLCCLHDRIVFHPLFARSNVLSGLRARIVAQLAEMQRELKRLQRKSPAARDKAVSGADPASGVLASVHRQHVRMAGSWTGGPAALGEEIAGYFGPLDDHSAELINLIVSTVNPDRWRTGGGDATISYWQPGLVLVVSAGLETQDRIESLLIGLRGR